MDIQWGWIQIFGWQKYFTFNETFGGAKNIWGHWILLVWLNIFPVTSILWDFSRLMYLCIPFFPSHPSKIIQLLNILQCLHKVYIEVSSYGEPLCLLLKREVHSFSALTLEELSIYNAHCLTNLLTRTFICPGCDIFIFTK